MPEQKLTVEDCLKELKAMFPKWNYSIRIYAKGRVRFAVDVPYATLYGVTLEDVMQKARAWKEQSNG